MRIRYYIYIALLISLIGCESDSCFKKAGSVVEKAYTYDTISKLIISGLFDVELISDSTYYIEVSASEALLKGVSLEQSGNSITCYNYNNCFWRHNMSRPVLRVHYPYIHEMTVRESAYLYSNDTIRSRTHLSIETGLAEADLIFNTDYIYFYINKTSGGRYNFYGKSRSAFFMNYNAGLFDMSGLETETTRVRNFSTIDMKVHVTEKLFVEIYDEGNILYKGCPEIQVDSIISSGRPIKID